MFSFFLIQIFLIGFHCNEIEQIIVAENQPFSFDCQNDESVYFGSTLNNWSELHDGDFDLNFRYLNDENLLRIQTTNAQKKHVGFYGCRKATWTSTAMNVVYQLIFAGKKNSFEKIFFFDFSFQTSMFFIGISFVTDRANRANEPMINTMKI